MVKRTIDKDDTGMAKVLIIDDDEQVCRFLSKIFKGMGYDVSYELTLKQGLSKIFSNSMDILFLDVHLPDGNGLEAIDMIRQHPFAPEIIIITADENVDGAEIAMKSRVWDYISKAGSSKNFRFALERAVEYRRQKKARRQKSPINRDNIIGESRVIQKCLEQVASAADSDIPVLITGETGTGKELFSKAIHANSKRSMRLLWWWIARPCRNVWWKALFSAIQKGRLPVRIWPDRTDENGG
jgi:two-component system, NtrC family, response regulator